MSGQYRSFVLAGLAAAIGLCFACGCGTRASDSGDEAAAPDCSVLDAAPTEWGAFQQWAARKLQEAPAAVPLPNDPLLPEQRWPVLRLDDPQALQRATKQSDYRKVDRGPAALAEVGPFRSDRPQPPTFVSRIAQRSTKDGKDALKLVLGLRSQGLKREQIGAIELELRIPFGDEFTLKWGKAGEILLPFHDNQAFFSVRVRTDGFAEWTGPLSELSLMIERSAKGVVEIRKLRFLSKSNAYPEALGVARVRLEREIRTSVYMHCPSEVRYSELLPASDAKLQVGLATISTLTEGAPAKTTFEVSIESDGARETLATRSLAPAEAWHDISVSLSRWAGKTVTIGLRAVCETPGSIAFWGNPIVYQPVEDPPLVVLYLVDTLASEHLGLYGYARRTMPYVSAIARRGTWFSQMISNSSRTVESIPDLMLSMTTERHGVYHNLTPAPRGLVTLAETMQAAGFATASFITNVYAGPRANMDQGFDHLIDKIGYHWTRDEQIADRTVPLDETLHWLDTHRDRPMFMYIHTAEPHAPYTPKEQVRGKFATGYRGPINGTYDPRTGFQRNARTPQQIAHVMSLYDEEVLYADTRFGLFLAGLKQRGLLEKANLIITADHGEEFRQHGMWEHGLNVHNEQTHVPLVLAGPLFAKFGRIDAPVQINDIMPTILDLFDLPQPYKLVGRSLRTLAGSEAPAAPAAAAATAIIGSAAPSAPSQTALEDFRGRTLFGSNHNFRASGVVEYFAIEHGRWKLIFGRHNRTLYPNDPNPRFMLFDLAGDPRERQDVLRTNQDVGRRLIEKLVCWRAAQHPYDVEAEPPVIDRSFVEDLEDLGYAGGDTSKDLADEQPETQPTETGEP